MTTKRRAKSAPRPPVQDRRRFPRVHVGLVANIGGRLVDVVDVSAKGMTLARAFDPVPGPMPFILYPAEGHRLDLNHGVRGHAVLTHQEPDRVGVRFDPPSMDLVKLVVDRAG